MRYWDASAIIPLFLQQPASNSARSNLDRDPELIVWWGTPIECYSALGRVVRAGDLPGDAAHLARATIARLRDAWTEVQPTEAVRSTAERLLQRHPLRAADAFQLGAALEWADQRPDGHGFVTLDKRLAEVAAKEGFVVAAFE